ncbi:MAG: proton-conducting transporter membrane subunit [Bacteroidota bacterium]
MDQPFAFTWLIVIISVFWLWMSASYLKEGQHQTDKTSLVIFVVLGAGDHGILQQYGHVVPRARDPIAFVVCVGRQQERQSWLDRVGIQIFPDGSFATGFLIFGIALVYGASHSFDLGEIFNFVRTNSDILPAYFYAGVLLMMVGLAFKISSVPFHFWAPDVYEGAPTAITYIDGYGCKNSSDRRLLGESSDSSSVSRRHIGS